MAQSLSPSIPTSTNSRALCPLQNWHPSGCFDFRSSGGSRRLHRHLPPSINSSHQSRAEPEQKNLLVWPAGRFHRETYQFLSVNRKKKKKSNKPSSALNLKVSQGCPLGKQQLQGPSQVLCYPTHSTLCSSYLQTLLSYLLFRSTVGKIYGIYGFQFTTVSKCLGKKKKSL